MTRQEGHANYGMSLMTSYDLLSQVRQVKTCYLRFATWNYGFGPIELQTKMFIGGSKGPAKQGRKKGRNNYKYNLTRLM